FFWLPLLTQTVQAEMELDSLVEHANAYAGAVAERRASEPLSNLRGRIVWGAVYELDAMLEMFRTTADPIYIEQFTELMDQVIAARADKLGLKDSDGVQYKGWPIHHYSSFGIPKVLLDEAGEPSFVIQGIANFGNNLTTVEIIPAPDGESFSLVFENTYEDA